LFLFLVCLAFLGADGYAQAETAPPTKADSRTEWCKAHPTECREYKTKDAWIDDQVEYCIDQKGNRDGKADPQEIAKFADECR
jgi:hypothetical protein